MKKIFQKLSYLILLASFSDSVNGQIVTQTLSYTGASQNFTIPACASPVTITCYGAQGANGASTASAAVGGTGGLGALAKGVYNFPATGTVITVYVGGAGTGSVGGFNGGGNGGTNTISAGAGGGASDVRYNGITLSNRIIVAGGGGGGGDAGCASSTIAGGNGGAGGGGNGTAGVNSIVGGGGQGGVGTTGGAAGIGCSFASGTVGLNGITGIGGKGGDGPAICGAYVSGGGGGGGYNGGGGGGGGSAGTTSCTLNDQGGGGGGAGGTNYFAPAFTGTTITNGTRSGNGLVVISYSIIPSPTVSVNSGSLCSGQSFVIVPSGASSYTIQGGTYTVSPGSTATYTVVGSNSGCMSVNTATSTITVFTTPTISVNSGSICSGGSFTINPNGASTYTIQGGNSVVTPTNTSSYTVTGTSAAGCVGNIATSNVTVNPLPTVTVVSSATNFICVGQTSTLTAGGASTYSWNTTATTAVIVISPTTTTSYTVIGTALGCTNTAVVSQSVSPCTGINSINNYETGSIEIYPNPTNGSLTIVCKDLQENKKIEIFNSLGQLVYSEKLITEKTLLSFEHLPNGIYFVKETPAGKTIKVIKQ